MAENVGVLSVTVTAVDKATATINAVRDRVGTVAEPARQLTAAFGRLSEASGLARVNSGLATASGHATSFAKSLAFAAVPLAGGGIIAGATSSATSFINTGRQLLSGARALEMSVPQLHAFQNGARLAGIGAEDATEGLKSFNDILYDAAGGRNAEAMAASQLPRLGFALRDASGRARTAGDALGDVADSIARLNNAPREQAQLARVYGVEALLPLLRRGRAGVADLLTEGRRMGTLTQEQAEQAKRLERQWDSMRFVGDRLALTIGGALAPAMERGATRALTWAQANEGTISTALVGRLEQAGRGTWTFVSSIDKAVSSTIGWETATTALEAALGLRLLKTLTGINAATAILGASSLPAWALRLLGLGGAAVGAQMAISQLAAQRDQTGERQREQERNFAERARLGGYYGDGGSNELYSLTQRLQMGLGTMNRPGPGGFGSGSQRRGAQDESSAAFPTRSFGADAVGRRQQEAFDFFRSKGWSAEASAGIVARLHHESGLDPQVRAGDGGRSHGMQQMNGSRLTAFRERHGGMLPEQTDARTQYEHAHWELTQGPERAAGDRLRGARTGGDAGHIASKEWERPGVTLQAQMAEARATRATAENFFRRLTQAPASAPAPAASPSAPLSPRSLLEAMGPGAVRQAPPAAASPLASPAPAAAPPVASPLDGAQSQRMNGSVDVNIHLAGAGRDTKVLARSEGIASVAPPRVERAMLDWDGP
ncbi:phage tail tip lysozyme [Muricoccus nepalensis]|uniref:phage tail tip lysozyme n=1 Tax=Muricoccus nepalensis TaxID=1854500 RepID=UPI0013869E9C|nr:phage tail tip lysozyme [Roseomonas nepalensis]